MWVLGLLNFRVPQLLSLDSSVSQTAEVHIKLFLRTNINLSTYRQKKAVKGQNRRHFSHSELEGTIRVTEMEPTGEIYLPWKLGEEVTGWRRRVQPN